MPLFGAFFYLISKSFKVFGEESFLIKVFCQRATISEALTPSAAPDAEVGVAIAMENILQQQQYSDSPDCEQSSGEIRGM